MLGNTGQKQNENESRRRIQANVTPYEMTTIKSLLVNFHLYI